MNNLAHFEVFSNSYFAKVKPIENDYNISLSDLFIANLDISQYLYREIMVLEILLRFSINRILEQTYGTNWINKFEHGTDKFVKAHVELEQSYFFKKGFPSLSESQNLDSTNLGFWVEFFERNIYRELKGVPLSIFTNKPKYVNRKYIYKTLLDIKSLRNYIYHHRNTFEITSTIEGSIARIESLDNQISNLISWTDKDIYQFLIEKKTIDSITAVKKMFNL